MGIDPTQRVQVGRSTVVVTRLGLGTAPLGNLFEPVDEAEAVQTVSRALGAGLRLVDTAPLYGHGLAERRVGRALAELGAACPADLVVATKVGRLLRRDAPPDPTQMKDGRLIYVDTPDVNPVFDFSAAGVRESVESSLERLGRDHLDVVHLHDPDDHFDQALGEAYPALVELREKGVVRAISVGMNQAEMLVRFAEAARFDCFLLAGRYTLLDTSGGVELLPLCADQGIGVLIGGVFNSGILADPRPGSRFDYAVAPREVLERAQAMAEVCERHGVSLKAAALQFPFGHPAVTSVLIGARSTKELEENLAVVQEPIPAALWEELRERELLADWVPCPAGDDH
jgi:D-threo-aldose 1-dehydrogenase